MSAEQVTDFPSGPSPDTLQLIVDYTKDAPERQAAIAERQDRKALGVFGIASLLVGIGGLSNLSSVHALIPSILLTAALIVYSFAAWHTLAVVQTRHLSHALFGAALYREHWFEDQAAIRHSIADAIAEAFDENMKVLEAKGKHLQHVVKLTAYEVALVVVALILGRLIA